jgi:spore coat protein CotH
MKLPLMLVVLIILGCLNCNHSSESGVGKVTTALNKNVPFISIKSDSEIEDEPKKKAQMTVRLKDSVLLQSNIGIEIRGAVSQDMYEKKSYGFDFRNEKNETVSHSILGLPKNSTWILHGPYGDKTLLRNAVAYKISNNIGKYAARTAFVELEINGNYLGFYVLMEKLKHDKDRIKIEKLTKKDTTDDKITGGYILKIDKNAGNGGNQFDYNDTNSFLSRFDENGKLTRHSKTHFMYEYPKAKNITPKQSQYIQKYLADFENSLASADFKDEEKGYKNFIVVESFIDYFILTEFFQNHDGYRLSTYLQKDRNKK